MAKAGSIFAFAKNTYQYLFLDDWKYWIMDDNPTDCDLINREFQK